ncbi:MAG: triphosphoribosyl-dephospho-CoA synthase, partial [Promethearchaeota archaeon]
MSVKEPDLILSIKSVDDLMRCINLASLLELAGWPKPGNVHRTKDFENTRFEHFLSGIAAIQPTFRTFCEKIFHMPYNDNLNYGFIELGILFVEAAEQMIKWQSGGNVLLGHILILAPLTAAVILCIKSNSIKISDFRYHLNKIIDDTTVEDTINLYKAIRICNPGGLGKIDKYDINNENTLNDIRADNLNLKKIFNLSKEYDLISSEYSTGFDIILDEGLPYILQAYNQFGDPNIAIVNTFLKILASHPDTLIIRKSGLEPANAISVSALKIVKKGGISTPIGLELTIELDGKLQEQKGKMNPGTTADLIAGVIFCAL